MEQDVTREIISLIIKSNMSFSEISRKSGVSRSAITAWVRGRMLPSVKSACWVLTVLGYDLKIKENKKEEEKQNDDCKMSMR